MRTRARGGAVSPPPALPANGVKRGQQETASLPNTDSQASSFAPTSAQQPKDQGADDEITVETPRKAKRVRFSDPGPSGLDHVDSSQSTGLTPCMRKTRLEGTPNRHHSSSLRKRRATLPPRLDFSTVTSSVEEMQFVPLRDILSERTRRRLRRNHMSEEMNDIEAEQRDVARARRELERLKAQEEVQDERLRELMWELESQRQLGIDVSGDAEDKVKALQAELEELRATVAQHREAGVADSSTAFADDQDDSDNNSPAEDLPSPLDIVYDGQLSTNVDYRPRGEKVLLEKAVARLTQEACEAKSMLEQVRSGLQQLGFARSHTDPEDILSSLRQAFRTARLELEYALPGETPNGFEDGRLLLALVERIRSLGKRVSNTEAARNQHQQSETALRGQFNKCLERAEHLENRLTVLEATRIELTGRLKNKDQLVSELELASDARKSLLKQKDDELDDLREELSRQQKQQAELDDDAKSQGISMEKLKAALVSYRDEIAKLESLVTEMDDACTAAKSQAEAHQSEVASLKEQRVKLEGLLLHREELLRVADEQAEDDQHRLAELDVQLQLANKTLAETQDRLNSESLQHARTKEILTALQIDIEKANDRATAERKRDSGAFCL